MIIPFWTFSSCLYDLSFKWHSLFSFHGFLSKSMVLLQVAVVMSAFPATPLLLARARICISASHTKEDLIKGLEVIWFKCILFSGHPLCSPQSIFLPLLVIYSLYVISFWGSFITHRKRMDSTMVAYWFFLHNPFLCRDKHDWLITLVSMFYYGCKNNEDWSNLSEIVLLLFRIHGYESFNGCAPSMVTHLNSFFCQVISRVGDLVGIKYFPAQPKEQQQEEKTSKLDWKWWTTQVSLW